MQDFGCDTAYVWKRLIFQRIAFPVNGNFSREDQNTFDQAPNTGNDWPYEQEQCAYGSEQYLDNSFLGITKVKIMDSKST